MFIGMAQASRQSILDQAALALVLLGAMLVAYAATSIVERACFGSDRRESALTALTASDPNVGSAGLPIVAALFSKSASISLAVAVAAAAIVVTPLSLLLLESANGNGANVVSVMKRALLQPIVIAPGLGLLCSLSGFAPPRLVESTLALVGQGASGTALFPAGLALSAQPIKLSNVGCTVAMKNVLQPLLVAALALPLLDGVEARVAVIADGRAVRCIRRAVCDPLKIGTMLILSTLLSTVTLTAAILLSSGWHWA